LNKLSEAYQNNTELPLDQVIQKLSFLIIKKFSDAWEAKAKEVTQGEFQLGAASFQDLASAMAAVNDTVADAYPNWDFTNQHQMATACGQLAKQHPRNSQCS
jgi:hypothetical protein